MQHVVTVAVGIWFHSYFAAHVYCLFVIYAADMKANSDILLSGKYTCMWDIYSYLSVASYPQSSYSVHVLDMTLCNKYITLLNCNLLD